MDDPHMEGSREHSLRLFHKFQKSLRLSEEALGTDDEEEEEEGSDRFGPSL